MKKAATLADVARAAGVSRATASKALNGRAQVSEEARARVNAAAKALSFTPNPFAQALNWTRTNTIGMLTSDLDNRFVLPILLGAEDAFGAGSLSVLLADARDDPERERVQLESLLSRRVDGLLIVGRTTNPRHPIHLDSEIPTVYVYAPSIDQADTSFEPDNELAGQLAAEKLISIGRTRIAMINGEGSYAAARDRLRGAVSALEAVGLRLTGDPGHIYGHWSERWGREAAQRLLEVEPDIDGIIGGSDEIARGAMDAIRESGRTIPDDIAVIGFDNWDIFVDNARPPLTSIDMNLQALGRASAKALVAAIDGAAKPARVQHPVHIVERRSA